MDEVFRNPNLYIEIEEKTAKAIGAEYIPDLEV
ncbi:hypothetical protein B0I03_105279 [Flavobacterium aquaticum]|uniref:Uncharacterized protein n=1 Tax=Flavobacterium aquaticum TaxID=1236486 RepID=A0A327YLK3_9FLAO|nr:hypothetical protein B0I03_105279 [Flavobacterium aquaticum]